MRERLRGDAVVELGRQAGESGREHGASGGDGVDWSRGQRRAPVRRLLLWGCCGQVELEERGDGGGEVRERPQLVGGVLLRDDGGDAARVSVEGVDGGGGEVGWRERCDVERGEGVGVGGGLVEGEPEGEGGGEPVGSLGEFGFNGVDVDVVDVVFCGGGLRGGEALCCYHSSELEVAVSLLWPVQTEIMPAEQDQCLHGR